MLHVARLVPQLTIVTLYMPQSLHLYLDIVKLASTTVVIVLRSVRFKQLLT